MKARLLLDRALGDLLEKNIARKVDRIAMGATEDGHSRTGRPGQRVRLHGAHLQALASRAAACVGHICKRRERWVMQTWPMLTASSIPGLISNFRIGDGSFPIRSEDN
jgi:hypothetical protein